MFTNAVSSMTVDRIKSVDLSLCMMWQSSDPGDPPSSSSSYLQKTSIKCIFK